MGQAKQPLKRRRKVSSADAESEPPYNIPSPYLWVYGIERGDNVKVRCGSSRSIGAWELLEYYSNRIEPYCRKLVGGNT